MNRPGFGGASTEPGAIHSTLASRLRTAPASFHIDEFDEFTQTGWSVLVRGAADYVESTDMPADEARPHVGRGPAHAPHPHHPLRRLWPPAPAGLN